MLQGGLDSINGRDRTEAFNDCMKSDFPQIKVFGEATNWDGAVAAQKLQTDLTANPDIKGVYMQSSFALSGTLQVLKQKGLLVAPERPEARLRGLQRRHPRGAQGHRGGPDRRHRVAARRPVRQVRPVLRQGRDRREDVQARPDRPRQHDHPGPRRPARGPALRTAGHPRTAAPTAASPASRATTSRCGATTSADLRNRRTTKADGMPRRTRPRRRRAVHRGPARRRGDGRHQEVRVDGRAERRSTSRSRPGQTHALVGRNGAGKSTLVSILTGLQAPDEGTVTFDGRPAPRLADRDAWRQRVACVYQKSTIIPELTVAENLFLNRHDRGRAGLISWSALRRRARGPAADLVGGRRPADLGRRPVGRAAAVRGDRPGAVVRGAVHHPRRADRPARRGRDQPAVRPDPRPAARRA